MDLKEEEILGADVPRHWYYRSKAAAMLRALEPIGGDVALDIGSGSGFFAKQLLEHSSIRRVDCVDTSYPADVEESMGEGKLLRRIRNLDDADSAVDVALLMDVLEHVEDDLALLRAAADRVRPGGRVLVTVPAFSWLWSGHDEFLEHYRRYTLGGVERLMTNAGLTIERGHYLYGLVLPAAAAQRLASRLRPQRAPGSQLRVHNPLTNGVLTAVSMTETRFQRFNRLGGLSVCVVAKRP